MKRFMGLAFSAFIVLSSTTAWAQATAQMSGAVKDESGAVLPGATVTATQTDTGFTRSVVTGEGGTYAVPNLPVGPYKLEVSLQGFRTYSRTGIVLQVNASPVINVNLAIGTLEETVSVQGAAPIVDVKSAGISEVVDQDRIVDLPLQGREVTALIVLAGAAVNTGDVSGARNRADSVAISVAGGMRTGVAYTLDGALHNDHYDNLNMAFPFPDALQEFEVATGGLSAESGMHSGAAVNAVTKSGTNRFSGAAFEFVRDKRFNATNPFAALGPDGKRLDDGLSRHQYGGTLGGPIIADKLFFFGGIQSTRIRSTPTSYIGWVPNAAMLAGDFTARASAACNNGRAITLKAPFVNNRIDPALLSPAAVAITKHLPTTSDPCGEINFGVPFDANNWQAVGRVDYQLTRNQSFFGRYLDTADHTLPNLSRTGNVLTVTANFDLNKHLRERSTVVGHTAVLGTNTVNAIRGTWNKSYNHLNNPPEPFFDAKSVGINLYTYVPNSMAVSVTDGFTFSGGKSVQVIIDKAAYQVDDQLTLVRGRHQIGVGANVSYWTVDSTDYAHSNGTFTFNGTRTGSGLADFLTGELFSLQHGAPSALTMGQTYLGLFAQDSWKMTDRVTLNAGLRWEPYLGQSIRNGAISNFSLDNFEKGVKTTQYTNAPPGLLFPGDPGFGGKKGINTQWWNLSPRAGLAWDVAGNGRTAVRTSYAMSYDFPTSQFMYKAATSSPFSNRLLLTGDLSLEDPYRNYPGGDPQPTQQPPPRDALFPAYSQFQPIDPNINSTRVQSWNATVEQQVGSAWLASVSYLGTYIDRLWGEIQMNPGVFMGLGACSINGVSYTVCTTTANLNQRRVLSLQNPVAAAGLSYVSRIDDVGTETYRGLKLSLRRRAAKGVALAANYTVSNCQADTNYNGGWFQYEEGYTDPNNPSFDRGNCTSNRTHIGNASLTVQTPQFDRRALRALASDWRVAGIVNASSGSWLTVTTTKDPAGTGITGQRVDQVSDDVYGAKTLASYLDSKAFAAPTPGTLGNERNNSIAGPGYWSVDLALSRLLDFGTRRVELRAEVFNLLNTFNWGNPQTNFDSGAFGRITSMAGAPRIMQFGIKYGF